MKCTFNTLLFTLSASLAAMTASAAEVASDNAADSAYDGGFTNGADGGAGTGAWAITLGGSNATSLTGNSRSNGFQDGVAINTPGGPAGRAFGLGSSDGESAVATLPLDSALQAGDTISFDFDFGFVETGGVVKSALQNSAGEDVLSVTFSGGGALEVNDNAGATDTLLGFSSNGFIASITLDSSTTYSGTIRALVDQSVATISGTLANPPGGQAIDRISFSANDLAPSGQGASNPINYFYFNSIVVDDNSDAPLVLLSEAASDSAYDSGFTNGADGGTGTGAWTISTPGSSVAVTDNSRANGFGGGAGVNTPGGDSGRAFGMGAALGETATATVPFDTALQAGDILRFRFDNGFVQTNGIAAASVQNASGEDLVTFQNVGDGNREVIDAGGATDTGLGFTSDGFEVEIEFDSATTYTARIQTYNDGSVATISGTLLNPAGGQTPAQLTFTAEAMIDGDPNAASNQFFFNNIEAIRPASPTSVDGWSFYH